MSLSAQLSEDDGWYRVSESKSVKNREHILEVPEESKGSLHFVFKGKSLCGAEVPEDSPRDNIREEQCQTCFERVRNLYNSNKTEDAYKDL